MSPPLPSLFRRGGVIGGGPGGKEGPILGPQGSLLPAGGEDPGEEEEGIIVIDGGRRDLSRVGNHFILCIKNVELELIGREVGGEGEPAVSKTKLPGCTGYVLNT